MIRSSCLLALLRQLSKVWNQPSRSNLYDLTEKVAISIMPSSYAIQLLCGYVLPVVNYANVDANFKIVRLGTQSGWKPSPAK